MKNYTILLISIFLFGCTTVDQINKNVSQVNPKDGVDEKEAVFIAQDYCLKTDECRGKVRISTPEIRYDGSNGEWDVTFASKDLDALDFSFLINVDEKTGEARTQDKIHEKF